MKTVLAEPLTISNELLDELTKELRQGDHSFVAYDTKPKSVEEWLERTKGFDQVILANSKLPDEVITENPQLKYINIAFTGVDHVNVALAKEKNIMVSNAAGYSDEGVAELVIGFAISLLRQIRKSDLAVREGGKAADFLGTELAGKTVGIIGTGHIGKRVAELFKSFHCKLVGYSRTEKEDVKALGLEYVSLEELLQASDIVTLHLPQNETTKAFLGEKEFSLMKDSAIFINCARGPIIDGKALAKVLEEKKIYGAAIDVFDKEPPLDQNEALLHAPSALLTPHIAYFTKEAMEKRANIVLKNARNFVQGQEIDSLV